MRASGWMQIIAGAYLTISATGLTVRSFTQGETVAGGLLSVVSGVCAVLLILSVKEHRTNVRADRRQESDEKEE